MLNRFNERYKDRGVVKWQGMFLSEHNSSMDQIQKELKHTVPKKEQMSFEEISEVLNAAVVNNKSISIQLESVDENNNYFNDIVGKLQGHDELGLWVSGTKVNYDEIRNVEFYDEIKWSSLDE
ncbi:hypothetical protein CKN82_11065 [Carnobacterium divergens]|uniref:hypothetical protein n=1 Tax=Carnobacterium divergens TaxID=2748 RepID=UPI0010723F57|nr:hypothetical protein [Carnobacterium divergens]TFI66632.1 hypothetical protein CKN70_11220 [Carnobacterium divergens]TFI78926.1 hypothetical protein CKN68_11180 [Carnobacterium divergens]TFI86574.1 hypothetical protein CKN72_10945 [Carnobacterium divergens]TFI95285.1 hypothetical protein CKN67_11185 [Carnobacterium divergens]TFI96347.1 hypothetical protein CKN82_11065 [Carnobacterium divergens]